MNLQTTIKSAQDFTDRLEAALALDDLDMCNEILALRAPAMAAFEAAHRGASESERQECANHIRALAEADQQLQKKMTTELERIAGDLRRTMGSTVHGGDQAYSNAETQACVDRKA